MSGEGESEVCLADGEIHVTVMNLDGTSIELVQQDSQTVAALLEQIVAKYGKPEGAQQRLLHDTEALPMTSSLKDLQLSGRVVLTLVQIKTRYVGLAKNSCLGKVGTVAELFAERSFTVEAWVRVHEFNTRNQGDNAILGCTQFEKNKALVCQLRNGVPMIGFYYNDTCASKRVDLNTWSHLVFAYDFDAKEQMVYMDGELVGKRSPSEPLVGNYDVVLGEWAYGGRYLNGEIAMLNIWRTALALEEVQEAMLAGSPSLGNTSDGLVRSVTFHKVEGEGSYRLDAVSGEKFHLDDDKVIEVDELPFC